MRWADLSVQTTVVTVSNKGVVQMPRIPWLSDGKPGRIHVTVPGHPDLVVDIDVLPRYDVAYRASFSGSDGLNGNDGTDGMSGMRGSDGSIDPNHPAVTALTAQTVHPAATAKTATMVRPSSSVLRSGPATTPCLKFPSPLPIIKRSGSSSIPTAVRCRFPPTEVRAAEVAEAGEAAPVELECPMATTVETAPTDMMAGAASMAIPVRSR